MGDVVDIKKKVAADKVKSKTMCRHGFHKWVIKQDKQFDSLRGQLVTIFKCSLCGKEKVELL
ncbi:MAG: hypothetical protein ACI9Y1_001796 [Lentisphaeria bacterium]|jgi:hypothetical protein